MQGMLCKLLPVHFSCFPQVDAAEQARGYSPLTAAIARAASAEASRQPQATALAACAAQLLAAGADVAHAALDGSTPLHAAAEGGTVGCIDLLVRHGAPVNATDSAGRTPLAGAVLGRAPRVACTLRMLEHGASVPSGELVRPSRLYSLLDMQNFMAADSVQSTHVSLSLSCTAV